ncbi:MAG TPA: 3-phosphoserine/phosphohydroxythreonine transaminase [Acidobacteriota bacterium]|nr:3-phosphoserine/phosphohydroxythreonine transaminase [Acidobacteriota bacterium]HNB71446.1 3-phosphoserine/phosphohydroxythreonine transaminase [Acidobacteriota bacterium]HNG93031.1 3-phosphoserine/phosphohydroxythreonine transaminase [Acidobacteriota bacterium]
MSSPVPKRIFNFSAGPAIMPVSVLEQIRDEMMSLPGVGMSVLEISHRSKVFDEIIQTAEAKLRSLMGIPDNYHVLFLQGGASLQFSMVPINLLPANGSADYIVTGVWSEKAVKEAKKVGTVKTAGTTKAENFSRIPNQSELTLDPDAAYVHFTSNNTIFGTEWRTEPEVGNVPLICDASSDILSRPVDVSKYGMIYAGAQKNIGPSGVTLVIVRDDLLAKIPDGLHTMLDYRTHVKDKSLYNTPPTFGIYVIGLVAKWLEGLGGLAAMEKMNQEKAGILYDAIDASEFYRGTAEKNSRSLMNVCFRLPSEELEKDLIKQATAAGFDGLKGHRSVGGLRASIYNAFPKEGVAALVEFMKEFERKHA